MQRRKRGRVLNSILHASDIYLLPDRPRALPSTIWVEHTTACNLHCTMCAKSASLDRPPYLHLAPEFIDRLLPELHSASFANLLGFGEPLASPDFFKWLAGMVSYGCTTATSLNGLLLTEDKARKLLDSGISEVGFSLDATTTETYAKIREGGEWNKAIENIRRFVQMQNDKGSHLPYIRMSFCLLRENLHEAAEFADLAKSLGVRFIAVMDPIFYSQAIADRLGFAEKEGRQAVEALQKRCHELGIFVHYMEDSSYIYLDSKGLSVSEHKFTPPETRTSSDPPLICPMLYSTFFVRADGRVAPCCYLYENVIGDLNQSTVSEIWSGDELASYRKAIREGRYPPGCRICRRLTPHNKSLILKNGRQYVRNTIRASRQRRKTGYANQDFFFIVY